MHSIKTFESLKNRNFCLYMAGTLFQMAGMNMQMMARQLLVYRLTGSATVLGTMSLAMSLPMLSIALFGGVMADRFEKKHILRLGLLVFAILAFVVGLALSFGYICSEKSGSWWILVAAAFLQGTVMGLMMPARQSIIPEIVGEELLMNALALNNLGMSMFRIISPAIAGFLIDIIGFEAVYYTMTVTNLLAALFYHLLPDVGKIKLRNNNALSDIRNGIIYLLKQKTIFIVLMFSLLVILLSMPYINLMPIFIDDILKVGASGMGTLFAIQGIGAGLVALFLASLPNKKRGMMFLLSGLTMGAALAVFSFSTYWYLSIIMAVFIGMAQTGNMTLSSTIAQYYVESQYRGRIMSILMMNFGITGLGAFLTSILADHIGVQWAVGGLASILFILAVMAIVFLTKVRRLD